MPGYVGIIFPSSNLLIKLKQPVFQWFKSPRVCFLAQFEWEDGDRISKRGKKRKQISSAVHGFEGQRFFFAMFFFFFGSKNRLKDFQGRFVVFLVLSSANVSEVSKT